MLRIVAAAVGAVLTVSLLSGCPAVVVGGAGATASVVHDRRTTGTYVEDQEIEIRAFQLLQDHPAIRDKSNISITSYNLAVLLTGQAAKAEVASEFANLVARLPRVKVVHNKVAVGAESTLSEDSSDAYVTSKVKLALFDVKVPGFDPTRVKVVTAQSVVYLMGLLTQAEQDGVVETVRRVAGVKRVVPVFETVTAAAQPAAAPPREQPAPTPVH